MIDRKSQVREVEQARAACRETEAACCTVGELLWALRDPLSWRLFIEAEPQEIPPKRTH